MGVYGHAHIHTVATLVARIGTILEIVDGDGIFMWDFIAVPLYDQLPWVVLRVGFNLGRFQCPVISSLQHEVLVLLGSLFLG